MRRKQIFADPTFWVLLVLNGYLVYRFYRQNELFPTLIWLYWSQGILLGIFTILDLLTVKNITPIVLKVNSAISALKQDRKSRLRPVKFFVMVYGALHLFYSAFLLTMIKGASAIDWDFFKYFFLVFLAGQIINFIQHKISQQRGPTDIGFIIFTPFIRVLPMHLTIVFASFFTGAAAGIFLILKSITDIAAYIATKPGQNNRETQTATLATEQTPAIDRL